MKRSSIYIWNIIGAIFSISTGTLLHFVNDWFSGAFWSVIGPVNESTWEHLKLIFFPMLAFSILEFVFYGRDFSGFLPIKVCSIVLGMLTTVVLFYTYTGILGFHVLALDITVFIVSILVAYCFAIHKLTCQLPAAGEFSFACKKPDGCMSHPAATVCAVLLLLLLLLCFIAFTFQPPDIGLFLEPLT